ncbi:hypothetical protein V1477_001421, partial [Vespula maculifrons]
IIWNIKSHIEAEECFKRQLKILTKEGTSLAIVHVCIMKRKKKKIHTCMTTKFLKPNMALFYKAWKPGTGKWEGSFFFKASNRELLQLEGISDCAQKDLSMSRPTFHAGTIAYFLRNQLIWNLIYEILDN